MQTAIPLYSSSSDCQSQGRSIMMTKDMLSLGVLILLAGRGIIKRQPMLLQIQM